MSRVSAPAVPDTEGGTTRRKGHGTTGFEEPYPTDGISRPIGDLKRFPAFDGLRAFAALAVVGVHTAFYSGFSHRSSLATYTARLEIGVSVFFVISGFLLYRPFVLAHLTDRPAPQATKFWIRRLFRIVPAYWAVLTISTYLLHVGVVPLGWQGVVTHYLFLQIYFPTQIFSGVGPAWSLCTEVSFYLFLPLYALAISYRRRHGHGSVFRRELFGLLTLTAISYGFRAWDLSHHVPCGTRCLTDPPFLSTMSAWLPSYLDLFAIGMLLALFSAWFATRDAEPSWLRHPAMPWVSWGLALLAFVMVSHLGISPQPVYSVSPPINVLKQTLYGLFALFLVAPAVFGPQGEGAVRRLLRLAPVAWLGVVSYGIYLWHATIIQAFFGFTSARVYDVPLSLLFVVVVGVTTVVATASYLLLEQPLLEFASRITRRPVTVARGSDTPADSGDEAVVRRATRRTRWRVRASDAVAAGLTRAKTWPREVRPRWFLRSLLAIVAFALFVRIVFTVVWTFGKSLTGDAAFYHQAANSLASGKGYAVTSFIPPHHLAATAERPPLFSMVLAAFDLLGLHSVDEQRILLAVIGAVGVLLVGLVARRVGGPAVGLIAAAIAALDPLWFQPGAAVMSESIYLVAIPAILLVAIGCVDHPGRIRFALLGGSCAVAVLIRSDALLFSVVLGVPLVLFISRSGRERLAFARCFLAGLALVLSPWLIRNEIQVGGVTLSDNGGGTVAGSYCPPQLNPHLFNYGGFNGPCAEGATGFLVKEVPPPNHARSWTELEINNALWSSTQPYIRAHLSALPSLALARIENTWGLARTTQNVYQGAIEGRVLSFERFGLELGRVLLVFELVGAVLLFRRSRARLYILMAPLVAVTIDSALFYGTTRFLALGLPSLTVLAALGLNAAVAWLRRRLAAPPHQRSAVEPAFAVAGQDRSEAPAGVAGMTPLPPG